MTCSRCSHLTASSSASWSSCSPPSNFVNGHTSTIWLIVCCWLQSHVGDLARPHLWRIARHGPWPVRKQFSKDRQQTREIETRLPDSRVSYSDHISQLPVLFPVTGNSQQLYSTLLNPLISSDVTKLVKIRIRRPCEFWLLKFVKCKCE